MIQPEMQTDAPVHPSRIHRLNSAPSRNGDYVLYWMQAAQRAGENPALDHAVLEADRLGLPLVAVFGLTENYPEATLRHYRFMLEGLQEVRAALAEKSIQLVLRIGPPDRVAIEAGRRAASIICDSGYLRRQNAWRKAVAEAAGCPVTAVEGDLVVPVETASDKREWAARTLRPKIHRRLDDFLVPGADLRPSRGSMDLSLDGLSDLSPDAVLEKLKIDRTVEPVGRHFKGGAAEAEKRFKTFIRDRLARYDENSNQPQTDDVSFMSPYLHFGQISPVYLARQVRRAPAVPEDQKAAFIEQLVVRRELAFNFVHYTPNYDDYACLPEWARKTLDVHRTDPRPYRYTEAELVESRTHDPYWNAAMTEMRKTGYMHNYMRMYWGKKILEWRETPEDAFRVALKLNNRYFLDGRDPNSYAGVGWVFGLHDRGWGERPVFGKVRYMAASGLKRKCDIDAYVAKTAAL